MLARLNARWRPGTLAKRTRERQRARVISVALFSVALIGIVELSSVGIGVSQSVPASFRIEVDEFQRVTMSGSNPSLAAVLDDLAWRAGFEIRGFGLPDHPISARFDSLPLRDVLRRLLGRDTYLAGVSVGADGVARVAWVDVPGPNHSGQTRVRSHRGAAEVAVESFRVPPGLFLAAFEGKDDAERGTALRMIEAQILNDPRQQRAFLQTDSRVIADALARYDSAPALLASLAARQNEPALRHKLEEVTAILRGTPGAPATIRHGLSRSPLADFFE